MWIFTKYGFFSTVSARQGDGSKGQAIDPNRVMIRGRVHEHLDSLKIRFPELLGDCEILKSADADYAYRLFAKKSAWTQVLAALAQETDYDNFKSEASRSQGSAGRRYVHALNDVWHVMHKLQK